MEFSLGPTSHQVEAAKAAHPILEAIGSGPASGWLPLEPALELSLSLELPLEPALALALELALGREAALSLEQLLAPPWYRVLLAALVQQWCKVLLAPAMQQDLGSALAPLAQELALALGSAMEQAPLVQEWLALGAAR